MSVTDAQAAVHALTRNQLRAALMCFWVKDPTSFWVAIDAAREKAS